MSEACFQTMKMAEARRALARLHEQVWGHSSRVEVTRRGSDGTCVIISKSELEALEQAIEILSAGQDMKSMEQMVAEVAAACEPREAPPA